MARSSSGARDEYWRRSPHTEAHQTSRARRCDWPRHNRRIAAPTPLRRSENDSRYVAIDNPGLDMPVLWLGRRFDPRGKLPPLRFTWSRDLRGSGPGSSRIDLQYEKRRTRVFIALWKPPAWRRFARSWRGRLLFERTCTRRPLDLRVGRSVLYTGDRLGIRRCGDELPERHFAVARIGSVVVTINEPFYGRPRADPYSSPRGLRAILNSLRERPAPALTPAD
jgi:hypothetical protein